MLGKLMKYEWKTTWKVPVLLIGILMFAAFTAGLTFFFPMWDSDWVGLQFSAILVMLLFYVAIIGTSLGTTLYFAVRYYKSMYTDEGYLTHTLPVSARQLLVSKLLTMSAWNLISVLAVFLSMVIFGALVLAAFVGKDGDFAFEMVQLVRSMEEIFADPMLEGFGAFLGSMVLMFLVSSVAGVIMITGAINLGQLLRQHRVLGAVGAYFAMNTILQIVTSIVMFPWLFGFSMSQQISDAVGEASILAFYIPFFLIMSVVYLLFSVGIYIMSEYLVKKKLELE